jgi:hypothetical protein
MIISLDRGNHEASEKEPCQTALSKSTTPAQRAFGRVKRLFSYFDKVKSLLSYFDRARCTARQDIMAQTARDAARDRRAG